MTYKKLKSKLMRIANFSLFIGVLSALAVLFISNVFLHNTNYENHEAFLILVIFFTVISSISFFSFITEKAEIDRMMNTLKKRPKLLEAAIVTKKRTKTVNLHTFVLHIKGFEKKKIHILEKNIVSAKAFFKDINPLVNMN